jgi:hypothetical protein
MDIDSFTGDHAFLSNFAPCRVRCADDPDGWTYPSVEHAYQASKTLSAPQRHAVLAAPNPGAAKRLGRTVDLRGDWDAVKGGVMLGLLRQKFAAEPYRSMLAGTGEARLVEGNRWHDQEWGDCCCHAHAGEPGANMLGVLLERVRAETAADAVSSAAEEV